MNKYMSKKVLLVCLFALISSCLLADNEKLNVFVSILPQKYFAERLLGDNGNVEVLIGAGQSIHTYEPLPQQMGKLYRADIFFTVGIPFEHALEDRLRSLCPRLSIVASDEGINKIPMQAHHHHGHVHQNNMECDEEIHEHEEHEHHHNLGLDPHFWLDPARAAEMSGNMAKAIVTAKPELKTTIEANQAKIVEEMTALSEELTRQMLPFKGKTMFVYHPAFGYFAEKFGLIQKAVEIEGKEPAPKQLAELIRKCCEENIKVIFVQKQFPANTAETVASSINGKVVAIDPLAEGYIENLKSMVEAFVGNVN